MGEQNEGAGSRPGMPGAAIGTDSAPKTLFSDLLAELETPAAPAPARSGDAEVMVCTAALESIGHLQKEIQSMWGTTELDVFISRLFADSRDGARQGLPREVADELVFLAHVNKMIRAQETAARLKASVGEAYRLVDEGDQSRLEEAQRAAARKAALVFASRHEESADGFLAGLWRQLSRLVHSRFIYLVIAAVGAMLFWPEVSALLHAFLK